MLQVVNSNIDPNWPNIKVEYHKPIELFIDSLCGYNPTKDSFKILWVKEADAISGFRNIAIENSKNFDAVLTYDEDILNNCSNSHLMLFGTTWIHNYEFPKKKFQVSHLTGNKNYAPGHILRQKVHYKQNKIIVPIEFYISKFGGVENFCNNKILKDEKNPLFNSQFHICIENSKQKNYFTEKLIDCFVTKTIPIYYGAPNIVDYFDIEGMFIVDNFNDIINVCNSLTENDYLSRKENIDKNFEIAQKYVNIIKPLEEIINKIIN